MSSPAVVADPAARYAAVRTTTERLAQPLSPEDCQVQSMPDVSPTKWHLAHTTWFFETFVLESRPGFAPFHPRYRYLFNSYYNAVGEMYPRPRRGLLSRPSLEDVLAYRAHVDEAVGRLLEKGALSPAQEKVVELGLHHEQQHQELLVMDIQHVLATNPLHPAYDALPVPPVVDPGPMGFLDFEAALVEIGHAGEGFAYDNEGPRHRVFTEAFSLADRPVTCGEYLDFMADGGYERPELWLSEGWALIQQEGWRAPLYWEKGEKGWRRAGLTGLAAVRSDLPVVHLSYYEADAFARWKGGRLPTEAEWERAALHAEGAPGALQEDGWLQPLGVEGGGLRQMRGDVWEWTSSPYTPYPGYAPADGALGEYNAKFMSNQMVLRGGCCATPGDHLRLTYRNFFPPHSRWLFGGVRLAKDAG